ncbi:MAG: dephospho-CoA kinase [Alphaproteobacteria bacterium]|nr:dephospho-CoA kinase [Alphaproteobacteria bacterium]
MRVLGLTGSIAMGKSTAARLLRRMGIPVYDADAEIHRLLARGGAGVTPVEAAFPGTVHDGAVDRAALGARVFGDPAALRRLEKILHPLARAAQRAFLDRHMRARTKLVCLDVPLLYETMGERRCDLVVVVSASPAIQRQRALARPGMTPEKLAGILARQMPDAKKRVLADIVAVTGLGHLVTLRALAKAARLARTIPHRRKD